MGSEQSSQTQRPPIQRGHTVAIPNVSAAEYSRGSDSFTSGNNSPATSMCSDSDLPYISYTIGRPIGDSPKKSAKNPRQIESKKTFLQRRQMSLQTRKTSHTRDIVVVKPATDSLLDEDIRRLQEIPTFLPIMRGSVGFASSKDPEVLQGLDYRPWVRMASRLQAYMTSCTQPLSTEQGILVSKTKQIEAEISRIHSIMVERQRTNARIAERFSRVHEISHQLSRCNFLIRQTLQDVEELNNLLPEDQRLQPFKLKDQQ